MRDVRISANRHKTLSHARELYHSEPSLGARASIQLGHFNAVWEQASHRLAFYADWKQRHRLPQAIRSLNDLADFPRLRKVDLQERSDLVFNEANPTRYYQTGGSTGEPTRFPRGPAQETDEIFADNYVGRAWWGIAPYERSALIWGHSHLYGAGLGRHVQRAKRRVLDAVGRTLRLDGYAHEPDLMAAQLAQLIRFRPRHIVGYSSAVTRLARTAGPDQRAALSNLKLRGVVVTAENLDEYDERLIRSTFGCPVIIEYGAAEAGVIGVSRDKTRNIRVLWNSQLVTLDDEGEALITTLSRSRQFPLINYGLGDVLTAGEVTEHGSVLSISEIRGRTADVVTVKSRIGATRVGALQLSHILKGYPMVEAVQFTQLPADRVRIHVKASAGYSLRDLERQFRVQLAKEFPALDSDAVDVVDDPHQIHTPAGKHPIMRPLIAPPSVSEGS